MSSGHDSNGKHGDHGEETHGNGHEEHASHEEKHEAKPEKKDENAAKASKDKNGQKPFYKSITESQVIVVLLIAILGRVLLKTTPLMNIPSVEPIIPLAVYAGMSYGLGAGALVGLLAYPISNMMIPEVPFDMWSFWQAAGGAIAGATAGLAAKRSLESLVTYSIIGTVLFEFCVNLPNQELLVWPFSFYHIVSNIFFAYVIAAFALKGK